MDALVDVDFIEESTQLPGGILLLAQVRRVNIILFDRRREAFGFAILKCRTDLSHSGRSSCLKDYNPPLHTPGPIS